jgi:hypothetical protein
MPKELKRRKSRGIKLNGERSMDMCTCYAFHCDPMAMSALFQAKIRKRLATGVHPPCGTMPCTCKSSLMMGYKGKPVAVGQAIDDEVKRSIQVDGRYSNQYWADLLGVTKKVIYDIKREALPRMRHL